jgi:hypothetical protein
VRGVHIVEDSGMELGVGQGVQEVVDRVITSLAEGHEVDKVSRLTGVNEGSLSSGLPGRQG